MEIKPKRRGRPRKNPLNPLKTKQVEPKLEPKQQEKGFKCPICNNKLRVCRTKALDNVIHRIRLCEVCGFKKPTKEI